MKNVGKSDLEDQKFVLVCTKERVPQFMPKAVRLGEQRVLICRDGDEFYAVDEICPHKQRSMRQGVIFQGEIICPHHQYHFDLKTGRCKSRCAPLQVYELRVIQDEIWVRLG